MNATVLGLVMLATQASLVPTRGVGSICLAPLPEHARSADHDYPGGNAPREYSYQFSVQVDFAAPVKVPERAPVLMDGIALGITHRVVIRDAGRVIESFRFTFEKRGSNHLCLAYGPWYQTWSLEPPSARQSWCKCQGADAAR